MKDQKQVGTFTLELLQLWTENTMFNFCTEFDYDCTAQEPTMLYVIRAPSRTDNAATTSSQMCILAWI